MKAKLGLVSVGQAAPPEVREEFLQKLAPHQIELFSVGALDALSVADLNSLTAGIGEDSVFVRVEGKAFDLSLSKIEQLLYQQIEKMKEAGVKLVLIRCTAPFSADRGDISVFSPYPFLVGLANGLAGNRIGVIIPSVAQEEQCKRKWSTCAEIISIVTIHPSESVATFSALAEQFRREGADFILMDCMGYNEAQRDVMQEAFAGLVVHPPSVYLAAVRELL